MATGVPVNPWATSLTVVTPSSTAVTPPSTQTAPPPMDKAGFKKLIEFRRTLLVVTPERPFSSVVAERFQALVMTSGEITPQARADLSKALAAEDQRRKDLDVERKAFLEYSNVAINEFQREHPAEALSVLEAYLKELDLLALQAKVFADETKMVKERIDELKK
jgi:hypothetical protein